MYTLIQIKLWILIDFSLTVKAATLIFKSGHGSAISSPQQGKSGSIELICCLGRTNACAFMKILIVYTVTDLTFINP